jgi:hypothetical protein
MTSRTNARTSKSSLKLGKGGDEIPVKISNLLLKIISFNALSTIAD